MCRREGGWQGGGHVSDHEGLFCTPQGTGMAPITLTFQAKPRLSALGSNLSPAHNAFLPLFLSFQNQLILGVMGIDVALNDIKKLTPRYNVRGKAGPVKRSPLESMLSGHPL